LNYRAIRRSIVETISNYKDFSAQTDSKEKYKTSSHPANSPKVGGEVVQNTPGARSKSKFKNTSRHKTIGGGGVKKHLLDSRQAQFLVAYFPTRQGNAAPIASQQKTCAHSHFVTQTPERENHEINVSYVTGGSYF